ncbi:hypothetical protein TBR22_A01680 [Luteitalea sp. TBR-22]|uniref:DUF1905 domain-containing protein n=1 Tax=Luteitalea sp. TBR-22 TaxID=2802971 RepID=UPI001AF06BAD|nr:DUF1905 domain-containing protein [Luteitalea sp. TBR-22]BCS30967.1 hypothetical protein TBR22_A01680 [Luteitalea sp. TBR-22]
MPAPRRRSFTAPLQRIEGKGGWFYVTVPPGLMPTSAGAWGRVPVRARLDDLAWDTSVWRTRRGDGFLPIPRKIRGARVEGAALRVAFELLDDD